MKICHRPVSPYAPELADDDSVCDTAVLHASHYHQVALVLQHLLQYFLVETLFCI